MKGKWDYQKSWEALFNAADDFEAETLEAVALKAGIFWKCPSCDYNNSHDSDKCGNCGEAYR
jgi:uncharacterized protein (DUF983 family)